MSNINWSKNETILISGEEYRFHSRAVTGELNLVHINDNRFIQKTDKELAELWEEGDLERMPNIKVDDPGLKKMLDRPFETLDDKTRQVTTWRAPYVREYVRRRLRTFSKRVLEPFIEDVANKFGHQKLPTPKQVYRWVTAWNSLGCPDLEDVRSIAPRYHLRGNPNVTFAPDVSDIVDDVIGEFWMVRTPEPATELYKLIRGRVNNLHTEGRDKRFLDEFGDLRIPSVRTLQRRLKAQSVETTMRKQRGDVAADNLCLPVGLGPQGTYPLEEIEIDHTLLDVIVVDRRSGLPLGRPWITVALDRYTRMIVGFHIGFKAPGAYTAMQCIRNAILPKTWVRKNYPGIRNEWPCMGKPKSVVVDNGPEFHSRSFKEACMALNIDIIYCPAHNPRYKGKIERWFRRLSEQHLKKIPGTTFSNPKERGDYRSEKKAVMSLEDLSGSILKWIIDDYSQSPHRGIDDIPVERWNEAVKRSPVSMPRRMKDVDILLSHVEERKLTRKGIEIFGLLYSAATRGFRDLINRPDMPERVKVRVNDDDLGSIQIEDWRTHEFIEVPATDIEYATGLRLAEHEVIKQKAKWKLKRGQRMRMRELIETKKEFHQAIRELSRNHKITSKKLRAVVGLDVGLKDTVSEVDVGTTSGEAAEQFEPRETVSCSPSKRSWKRQESTLSVDRNQDADLERYVEEDYEDNSFLERMGNFGIRAVKLA